MQQQKQLSSREFGISFPSIFWMILFFLAPSILIYTYAFKPADIYGGISEGWTLEAFFSLAHWAYFKILFRTIWISFLTTIICLLFAVPFGYQMISVSKQTRNLLLMLVVLPFWSSLLIRIYAWKTLLHPEGKHD